MATPVYAFETDLFAVSDNGIHLLRSGYNYETIPFAKVTSARIARGKELHNWGIVLAIGLALLAFAVYYVLRMVIVVGNDEVDRIYIEAIVVPVIPAMLGAYCVYSSMRQGLLLTIGTTAGKKHKLPLGELVKHDRLEIFESAMEAKLGRKLRL
ncbi:hypothetical protein [Chryseolinea lacunae]|uniref:Uncharacterized protein n=1 Tax=Chryseolinea lacunae TaxID=2801331 RepID=A0ABS1KX30_9BACT|nr:hypothetical protein [Chryseolinea lacunae]MBL0743885.1 hypothetical protein [Chryseolinea lacunae]